VAAGEAAPLAGLPAAAFAAVELIERDGPAVRRGRVGWREAAREPGFRALAAPRPAPFDQPRLMGVLNVTPDSFARDTRFPLEDEAVAHGLRLAEEGADIVDVGGESTRPGAAEMAVDEELRRVLPVVRRLAAAGVTVSIDTRKAAVMRAAVEAGARIVNDVSGLAHDPGAPAAAAASGAWVVLMHSRGEPATMNVAPSYEHAALEVYDELEARVAAAGDAGIARERIVIDPGLCFAKHEPHNLDVLRHLALYHGLGCPLLLGASRKGWTAAIHERWRPTERLPATLAAGFWGLQQGVHCLRVHDVDAHRQLVVAWRGIGGA
jgi:dihydropteroate synthase